MAEHVVDPWRRGSPLPDPARDRADKLVEALSDLIEQHIAYAAADREYRCRDDVYTAENKLAEVLALALRAGGDA